MDAAIGLILALASVLNSEASKDGCQQFSSPSMGAYICPGNNIIYTCTVNTSALFVVTVWSGTTFRCPGLSDLIALAQRTGEQPLPDSGSCGTLTAMTTNITSTCYTSVLIIPAVQAMNGTTVMCGESISRVMVGSDTIKITASPGLIVVISMTSTSVDRLTVTWTPPTTGGVPTGYSVSINDSSNTLVPIPTSGPLQYTFTGLTSDTLYTVYVVAINCAGNSSAAIATKTLAWPPENVAMVIVFNPNNTLHQLDVTWTPVGGTVTIYGVYLGGTLQSSTHCTTTPCFYAVPLSGPSTINYTVSVASINGGGIGPRSGGVMTGILSNNVIISTLLSNTDSMATIGCSFSQPYYCVVCCSTDPSVPPDWSMYNISTTRGTEVTVDLNGLPSGHMYYCKASATNTTSANCGGPVVGAVKVFFSFKILMSQSHSPSSCELFSTLSGIVVGIAFVISFFLGGLVVTIIICSCYIPRVYTVNTEHPPSVPTTGTYKVVGTNKKEMNTIELECNAAYGTAK